MQDAIRKELGLVIDEMSRAYDTVSSYESHNADYADYAVMALGRFRDALRNPDLTQDELAFMLRQAMTEHRAGEAGDCWKAFVASYMSQSANANDSSQLH